MSFDFTWLENLERIKYTTIPLQSMRRFAVKKDLFLCIQLKENLFMDHGIAFLNDKNIPMYSGINSFYTSSTQRVQQKFEIKLTRLFRKMLPNRVKDHEIDNLVKELFAEELGLSFHIVPMNEACSFAKEKDLESCMLSETKWYEGFNPYEFYSNVMPNTRLIFVEKSFGTWSRFLLHAFKMNNGEYALAVDRIYGEDAGIVKALKKISPVPVIKLTTYKKGRPQVPICNFDIDKITRCSCDRFHVTPFLDSLRMDYRNRTIYGCISSDKKIKKLPIKTRLSTVKEYKKYIVYSICGSENSGCSCLKKEFHPRCSRCNILVSRNHNVGKGIFVCDDCRGECSRCHKMGAVENIFVGGVEKPICGNCTYSYYEYCQNCCELRLKQTFIKINDTHKHCSKCPGIIRNFQCPKCDQLHYTLFNKHNINQQVNDYTCNGCSTELKLYINTRNLHVRAERKTSNIFVLNPFEMKIWTDYFGTKLSEYLTSTNWTF